MTRIDRSTSQFMDASRWIAALTVVLVHTTAVMMVDEAYASDPGLLLRLVFALKNAGHLAVVVFFVLSGYLVGGQELLRVLDGRRFDPSRYAIQRFSRIYTVLIPALLLTLLLDQTGQYFFNHAGLYTNPATSVGSLNYAISGRDDLASFLGNAMMLQTIAVDPFGGNGPLWTLANEWWYYVAFGCFLLASSTDEPPPRRIAALAALVLVLAIMPWTMVLLASIWLIGVAAAIVGQRWRGLPHTHAMLLLASGLVCAICGMSWSPALPTQIADFGRLLIDVVPALAFAVALVSVKNTTVRDRPIHRRLAGFSYSLYAVHFPILLFLAALANSMFGLPLSRRFDLACAATILAVTGLIGLLAWLFARLTERHTNAVRAALTTLFRPRLNRPRLNCPRLNCPRLNCPSVSRPAAPL